MCACDEYPGRKCAAHRALPDYRCDDYPELPDEGEAELCYGGEERGTSEDA